MALADIILLTLSLILIGIIANRLSEVWSDFVFWVLDEYLKWDEYLQWRENKYNTGDTTSLESDELSEDDSVSVNDDSFSE